MRYTEKQVEKAIRDYLETKGYLVVKTDAGHAARYTKKLTGSALRGDFPPGFPDLIVLDPRGPAWFIEVKRPGGRIRRGQLYMHDYLMDMGFNVLVAHSVEDVVRFLTKQDEEGREIQVW